MVLSIDHGDSSFKLSVPRFMGDRIVRWELRRHDRHPLAELLLMSVAVDPAQSMLAVAVRG